MILDVLRSLLPFKDGGQVPPSGVSNIFRGFPKPQPMPKPIARKKGGAVRKKRKGKAKK